jgi:hypothetical protein
MTSATATTSDPRLDDARLKQLLYYVTGRDDGSFLNHTILVSEVRLMARELLERRCQSMGTATESGTDSDLRVKKTYKHGMVAEYAGSLWTVEIRRSNSSRLHATRLPLGPGAEEPVALNRVPIAVRRAARDHLGIANKRD